MNTASAFVCGVVAAIASLHPQQQQPPATPAPPTPPKLPMAVAWEKEIELDGVRFVSAGRIAVVLSGDEGQARAFARDDGRVLWSSATTTGVRPVTIGRIVVFAGGGALQAVDQESGAGVWRATLDEKDSSLHLALQATEEFVFAVRGTEVRAWRPGGESAWKQSLPAPPSTDLVKSEGSLLVGLSDSSMVALDPATGATKWTAKLPSPAASLASADGQLFVPTQEKELLAYRITAAGLKRMWRHRDRSIAAVGAAAIGSRRVFYSMMDNTLKAFDRNGGTKVWTASLDSRPVAGPMLLGDDVIVPLASGDLAQISAATGRTPAKTDKPQAGRPGLVATAFFDGSAYVVLAERNETARLVAWRAAK